MTKAWESYEQVAEFLLGRMAEKLGLDFVEGKQLVEGRSGATWEIDCKGLRAADGAFIIIECRRRTTSPQKQEDLGGLAYRIHDTGAAGGIIVTPLGLQEGAKKVAKKENIVSVRLDEKSTTVTYVMSFLNQVFVGLVDGAVGSDQLEWTVRKADGTVERGS